jgi:hypothetical protein
MKPIAMRSRRTTPTPTPMPIFAVVEIPDESDEEVDEDGSVDVAPAGVIVVPGTTLVMVDPSITVVTVEADKTVGVGLPAETPGDDGPLPPLLLVALLPDVGVPPGTTVQTPPRHARSPSQSPFVEHVAPSQCPGHEQSPVVAPGLVQMPLWHSRLSEQSSCILQTAPAQWPGQLHASVEDMDFWLFGT